MQDLLIATNGTQKTLERGGGWSERFYRSEHACWRGLTPPKCPLRGPLNDKDCLEICQRTNKHLRRVRERMKNEFFAELTNQQCKVA
jgi:hypothetical protein